MFDLAAKGVSGIGDYYICSAPTTPGPGAHGMCGYHAVKAAIDHISC
ncbi:hypothetical protein [Mycolicibacterium sp.]|nr:hypothetical protein [Mycolicibacterium sp.]